MFTSLASHEKFSLRTSQTSRKPDLPFRQASGLRPGVFSPLDDGHVKGWGVPAGTAGSHVQKAILSITFTASLAHHFDKQGDQAV